MWYPGKSIDEQTRQIMLAALNDEKVKAELSKQIRVELDNQRIKNSGTVQSYESLTSGNVNMQTRMAVSGYDVYGRTVLKGNYDASNQNVYKKMKNKIKYGTSPQNGYMNRGKFNIV